jgi:hypothetical protein
MLNSFSREQKKKKKKTEPKEFKKASMSLTSAIVEESLNNVAIFMRAHMDRIEEPLKLIEISEVREIS